MNHKKMKAVPLGYEEEHLKSGANTRTEVNHLTRANCIFKSAHLRVVEDQARDQYGELEAVEERRTKEWEEKSREEKERAKEIEHFEGLMRKSKFNLNEQLSKIPAQISVMGLLLSSEEHRRQFLDICVNAHVRVDLPLKKLTEMVGLVMM